ncbi:MAG: response regulator [Actinomycetota bacterium]
MRVLIVDGHRMFAEAVRALLEAAGMEVLLATSGNEGMTMADRAAPDVAVVDVCLPDVGGIEVGRRILADRPGTKVLALSALVDPRALKEADRAGFHGYLIKDISVTHFVRSIRAAGNGHVVKPHRISISAPGAGPRSPEERDAILLTDQLTPREREVLALLVEGATSSEIMRTLRVSPNTVRTHIQSILTKLQVHSRLEAATFAVRYGIVKIPQARASGW